MESFRAPRFSEEQLNSLQYALNVFVKGCEEVLNIMRKVFERINIDQKFFHNTHIAKYSKKKRIRKKYLRKLIK